MGTRKRPLIWLILAVLILFWPALHHPTYILFPTFSEFSDTMVIHWPKAQLMAQTWQAGQELPYWTPLSLSGMPLAANQLAMLFYPPAWFFLWFPPEPIFNLLFIFHLLLGGTGLYLLLQQIYKLSPTAALLGSLTFALNGKWLAHAAGGHVSLVGAIGWLPWVILGIMKILADPSKSSLRHRLRWALLTAIMLALQLVTHPLIFLYSFYLIVAILAWHLLKQIRWSNLHLHTLITPLKPIFLPLLLIPLLTGLLGAVQLLPLLELAQFSNRALSLDQAAAYAVSPAQLLLGLFLPDIRAGHEQIIYLGLLPLLLAAVGLTGPHPWRWFYGGVLIFAILFALGPTTPLHSFFYHVVPGFAWVRTPARMVFMGAIALAVLVGFGVDRLRERRWSNQAQRWLTRWVISGSSFALLTGVGLALTLGETNRAILALTVFIPAGLILMLLRLKHILSAQVTLILLGIILFLDLASFDLSMMRFVPLAEALAPGRSAAEYLAQKPGFFRVYSPSYSLPTQTAAATGLFLADGVEPVHLAVYDEYMARAGGYHDPGFSVTIPKFDGPLASALKDTQPDLTLLGLLNVEYVASAFPMTWAGLQLEKEIEGTFIYRNKRTLPRAWVAHQPLLLESDWLTQLTHSLARQPAAVVLLENEPLPANNNFPLPVETEAVTITHYSANRLELNTRLDQPGWLVLSEMWYPGWQATVNDEPQPVLRVNGLLRGLYLSEPGSYQITLQYRPHSLMWGQWLSSVTAVLVIVAFGWLKMRE